VTRGRRMIPAPGVQANDRQGERVLPSPLTQAFLLPGLSMPSSRSGYHLIPGVSLLQSSIAPRLMRAQDAGVTAAGLAFRSVLHQ